MSSTGRDASKGGAPEIPELGTALHRNFPHRMVRAILWSSGPPAPRRW